MTKIVQFFREVRHEMSRVTWPSLKDTRMLTLMVFIMVTIMGVFLWFVDLALNAGINTVLGL